MKSANQIEKYFRTIKKYNASPDLDIEKKGDKYRVFSGGTAVTSWLSGDAVYNWLKGYDIGFIDGWEDKAKK